MRKLLLILLMLLGATLPRIYAQSCTDEAVGGQWPTPTIVAPSTTNVPLLIATNNYKGEYAVITLVAGSTYSIGNCTAVGGTNAGGTGTTITITDDTATGAALASGTATGAGACATFTPTVSGSYRMYIFDNPCGTASIASNNQTMVQCTSCTPPPAPACTTNSAPANAATGQSNTPTLSWAAAPNATSYDVYMSVPPAAPALVGTSTTASYTVPSASALNFNTTYSWYVVPTNSSGPATGCATSATTFTTAATVIPTPSDLPCGAPALVMSAAPLCANTTSYTVSGEPTALACSTPNNTAWVKYTPTVTGPIQLTITNSAGTGSGFWLMGYTGTCGTTLTQLTPTFTSTTSCLASNATSGTAPTVNLTAGVTYYFMIDGISGYSGSFCVQATPVPPPACTTNSAPANAALNQSITPTLSWVAAAGAASYDVYLGTGLPGVLIGNSATTSFVVPSPLSNGTQYTWYVVPKNASGTAIGCSASATTFTTTNVPPPCPVLSAPAAGATAVSRQPSLSWAVATGASSYQVYVGTTNPPTAGTIAGVTFPVTTTALSYILPSGTLTNGVTYYWAVVPVNTVGASTGCLASTSRSFTVAAATSPAAPANDEPCFAAMLPINPATALCATTVAGTTLNATNTLTATFGHSNPPCGLTSITPNDVWYYITTGASGNINLKLTQGATSGAVSGSLSVYSIGGAGCTNNVGTPALGSPPPSSNPTLTVLCSAVTPVAPATLAEQASLTTPVDINAALAPNTTYLVRVGPYFSSDAGGTFTLCANEILPPPNDLCINAINVPVTLGCTPVAQTINAYANDEGDNACGTGAQRTVYFKFTATAANTTVKVQGSTTTNDFRPVATVLSACGGAVVPGGACLTAAVNGGSNTFSLTGLSNGQTYFIRIHDFDNTGGTFDVCATPTQLPPVNDDPCAAVSLPVSNTCTYSTYTNDFGTATTPAPATPACGNYTTADVWFTAVVPASGLLSIDVNAGTTTNANLTNGALQVYTAPDATACATYTNWTTGACSANAGTDPMPTANLSALTPGQIVYIRVWGENGATGSFNICVTDPIPPANDNACAAVPLTVGATCSPTAGTTYLASNSATADPTIPTPAAACGTYVGADVWYTVVVPPSGLVEIATTAGIMTDAGMEVYTGTPASPAPCVTGLTAVGCNNDGGAVGSTLMPKLAIGNQPAGTTLWVRVYPNGAAATRGTFSICAKEIVPAPCVNSGATATQFPSATITPVASAAGTNTTVTAGQWKRQYSVLALTAGITYTMGNCSTSVSGIVVGGVNAGGTGTTVTITDATGAALSPPVFATNYGTAANAGACVTFTPTVSGSYRMYLADYPCNTAGSSNNSTIVNAVCPTNLSAPTVTTTVERCGAGTVTLTGTACSTTGTVLNWYSNAALTTLLGTGVSFTTASLAVGTYTYYGACALGTTGCKSPGSPVTITVKAVAPVVTASATDVTCSGPTANSNGIISISGFAATDMYQYSTGATFNSATAVPSTPALVPTGGVLVNNLANPAATQSYTVRVTSTNGTGCFTDVVVTLNPVNCAAACVNPASPTGPVNQNVCPGATVLAAALAVDAAATGFAIDWYQNATGGTALATATSTFTPSPLPSITTTYYAEMRALGYSPACVSTSRTAVTLNVVPNPILTITNPATACAPNTVDITAASVTAGSTLQSGTLSYWANATATTAIPAASGTAAAISVSGTYYIKVTTSAGCTDIKPVTVTISPSGTPPTTTAYTVCQGATVPAAAGLAAQSCTRQVTLPINIAAQPVETNAAPGNLLASVSLASLPAGTTLTGIQINIGGITALGSSWRSDIRIGLANAITGGAAAGISAPNSAGIFNYTQTFTAAAGITPTSTTLDLVYWDDLNDNAGAEATFPVGTGVGTVVLTYNDPNDIKWYTTATGGTQIGSGTPFNPVGVAGSGIVNTNTPGVTTLYASCETGTGCPGARTAVNFTVAPSPTLVVTNISSCTTPVDLTVAATTAGSTFPTGTTLSYWSDAAATVGIPAASGTQTAITVGGTYYIKATTPSNCTDIKAVTVTINTPPTFTAAPTNVTCAGLTANSDGKITLSAFGTSDTYQYSLGTTFDAATAMPATAATIPTNGVVVSTLANPATTQSYTVRVFGAGGCFADQTVSLSKIDCAATCVPPAAPANGYDDIVCAGSTYIPTVSVDGVSSAFAINWYSAATGGTLLQANSITYSPATAPTTTTTYYAETQALGYASACVSTTRKAVTVTVAPTPVLVTTPPAAVCTPNTINLTAAAVTAGSTLPTGTTLSYWVDAAATTNAVATPAAVGVPGTYYIRAETADGCFDIKSVAVNITTAPVAPTMVGYTICQGAAVPANAGMTSASCMNPVGAPVVIPIDIAAQPVETNAAPGNILTSFTLPTPPAGSVIGSIQIQIPGITALGSSFQSEVRIGLGNGVTNTAVTSPGSAGSTGTFTYNRTATINGLASGSTVDILYWDSTNDNATTADATFPVGTGVGTVTVTFAQSGITWYTAATGGTAIATGAVLNPVGVTSSGLANTNTPGVTTYYASCNSGVCEGNRNSVTFTINPAPILVTNAVSVCAPATANLTAAAVTAGSTLPTTPATTLTYWSNAAATVAIPASSGTAAAITVSGKYYIKATTGTCTDIDSVVVTINPLPTYTATPTDVTCAGLTANSDGKITLTAFGATATYQYSAGATFDAISATPATAATIPAGGVIASTLANPATAQTYTVRVFGAGGCFTDKTITLNNVNCAAVCNPPAAPTAPVNQTICANVTALPAPLSVASPGTGLVIDWYSAATGGTLLQANSLTYTPSPLPTATTSYYAETRALGYSPACVSLTRTEAILTIAPMPVITVTNPAGVCAPATIDITAAAVTAGSNLQGGTVTYWANAAATTAIPATSGTPAAITVSGTYYIKAVTTSGCMDIKPVVVSIAPQPSAPTMTSFNICQGGTPLAGEGLKAVGCTSTLSFPIAIAAQPAGETASPVASVALSGIPAGALVTGVSISIPNVVRNCTGTFGTEVGLSTTGALTIANGNGTTITTATTSFNYLRNFTFATPATLGTGNLDLLYTEGSPNDCTANDATFPVGTNVGTMTLTYQSAPMWYTAATGGTSIGSGTPFNPIGVAGTGVVGTNTPSSTTLYASCVSNGCEGPRAAATFTVDAPAAGPTIAAVTVCEGSPVSALNFTPCGNDTINAMVTTTPITTDGANVISNYTITIPAVPAYATVLSANLVFTNIVPTTGTNAFLSELRAAVSGAATLATTQYSTTSSATSLATASIPITVSAAGGTATVALSQTFNSIATSPDYTYGGVKIVIIYNQPLTWYDAATGGTVLATGAASCNFMPANQPLPLGANNYYAQYTNAQGCQSTRTMWTANVTPNTSNALAATSTPNVQVCDNIIHGDDGNYTYTSTNCERIATVDDGAGGAVLGSTNGCVTVQSGAPMAGGQHYLPRSFNITPTNNGPATVTLFMLQSELDALVTSSALDNAANPLKYGAITPSSYANMCVYKYNAATGIPGPNNNNGAPTVIGAYPTGLTVSVVPGTSPVQYSVTFPVTGFSGFYCAPCNPLGQTLPVDLLSFVGRTANGINILDWATASELNNAKFEVERSTDGVNFEYIGAVKGNGTTNVRHDYKFADNQPVSGVNYYRLRQIDTDGKYKYSNTIQLTVKIDRLVIGTIVPNPTSGAMNYVVYAPEQVNATLSIRNVLGQVIYTNSASLKNGNNQIDFDATELAAGTYIIFVQDAKGRTAQRQFVKVN